MLVLRQYESKSYESFVEWLEVSDSIVQMLGLKVIPHFTTLQKAAARLSTIMLHVAIGRFICLGLPVLAGGGICFDMNFHCLSDNSWNLMECVWSHYK